MGVGVSTLHVVTTTPECSSSVSRPVGMQPVCPLGSQRAPTFLSFSAAFLLAFLSFSLAFRLASFSAWRGKQMNRVDRQRMSHSTRQRTLHAAPSRHWRQRKRALLCRAMRGWSALCRHKPVALQNQTEHSADSGALLVGVEGRLAVVDPPTQQVSVSRSISRPQPPKHENTRASPSSRAHSRPPPPLTCFAACAASMSSVRALGTQAALQSHRASCPAMNRRMASLVSFWPASW